MAISSSRHGFEELFPLLGLFYEAVNITSDSFILHQPPQCDEVSFKLSYGKEDHLAGREMAPLIPDWVILEDLITILIILGIPPSNVDLLPHHNSLRPDHFHWHISTLLPLQLGLGVEELGLEGGNNVGIVLTPQYPLVLIHLLDCSVLFVR